MAAPLSGLEDGWIGRHRAEIRLAIRISFAGVLALLLAEILSLPQGVWAAITAVIVVQASVGASLKAAMDRLVGTIGGAAVGALAAIGLHYAGESWRVVAVFGALAPLALAAALNPSFRVAPVTALILLLGTTAESPIRTAFERVVEIGLGNVVGIAVALFILPARAHGLVTEAAKRVLHGLAELTTVMLAGLEGTPRPADVDRLHAASRTELERLRSATAEAQRERRSFLTDQPDPEPLARTLTRLRHDVVILGRVSTEPIGEPILAAIRPSLSLVGSETERFLADTGAAIVARRQPPLLQPLEDAYAGYAAEMAVIRAKHMTASLPGHEAGRVFVLAFAFEQLARDLRDLHSRTAELARE